MTDSFKHLDLNSGLDETGQNPEAYARWLRTLSDADFAEELSERRLDWNTCPVDQDDYNYEGRYDACIVEADRRKREECGEEGGEQHA